MCAVCSESPADLQADNEHMINIERLAGCLTVINDAQSSDWIMYVRLFYADFLMNVGGRRCRVQFRLISFKLHFFIIVSYWLDWVNLRGFMINFLPIMNFQFMFVI